jgi:hypothetical protein
MLAAGISYGRYSIYSHVNCAFSFVWPSTRFGLMTFIRRGLQGWELMFCWLLTRGMVMIEGGVVQNDLGYA